MKRKTRRLARSLSDCGQSAVCVGVMHDIVIVVSLEAARYHAIRWETANPDTIDVGTAAATLEVVRVRDAGGCQGTRRALQLNTPGGRKLSGTERARVLRPQAHASPAAVTDAQESSSGLLAGRQNSESAELT